MSTLLIIDDNTVLAQYTARNISHVLKNLTVLHAANCAGARKLARHTRPDMLIVDIKLPDGCGLDLARELAAELPEAKIIICSANQVSDPSNQYFGVLTKPFDSDDVVELVQRALPDSQPLRAKRLSSSAWKACGTEQGEPFDRHKTLNRLSGLVAGLRAFAADLDAEAEDAEAVRKITREYVDGFCVTVGELSRAIKNMRSL